MRSVHREFLSENGLLIGFQHSGQAINPFFPYLLLCTWCQKSEHMTKNRIILLCFDYRTPVLQSERFMLSFCFFIVFSGYFNASEIQSVSCSYS